MHLKYELKRCLVKFKPGDWVIWEESFLGNKNPSKNAEQIYAVQIIKIKFNLHIDEILIISRTE
jgi:hypothetical protein